MSFIIKNPGLLSTIQDSGRYGYQSTGISPAGALDYRSAMLANQLVNNDSDIAILEMTLSGISFEVTKNTTIAVVGALMSIHVNRNEYPIGRPIALSKGDSVQIGQSKDGLRAYLAVAGGFILQPTLGSFSTHLRTNMGGYKGRAIKSGDVLKYRDTNPEGYFRVLKELDNESDSVIRIIEGPNFNDLTQDSKDALLNETYSISKSNDRMGIRLEGKALKTNDGVHDILSEPTQLGNIQVPKNGMPIILLNDRQTTGGYKRMASVAKVDLPKLVQFNPNATIRFELITLEEAIKLYREEMAQILSGNYLKNDSEYTHYRRIEAERIQKLFMR